MLMCGVRPALMARFQTAGLAGRLAPDQIFLEQAVRQTSTALAIRHAYELIPDPCPTCPRRSRLGQEQELHYDI
jgi:hypothetical protein